MAAFCTVKISMKRDSNKNNGFTLVELLVVIAIIGILAALLTPALSKAKSHVRSVCCKNRLHQMGMALQMYVHDNQNKYPYYLGPPGPKDGDAPGKGGQATGLVYWSSKLFPYYPLHWTNDAFHCPGYEGKISGPYLAGAIDRQGSYAYNAGGVEFHDNAYFGLGPVMFWTDSQGNHVPPVSETKVSVPNEMIAIVDSLRKVGMDSGDDFGECTPMTRLATPYIMPHGRNYNQVFCDGHVATTNPSILFNRSESAATWNYDHQPHPELWMR